MGVPIPPGMSQDEVWRIVNDNTRFIPRLGFNDKDGSRKTLRRPFEEQLKILLGLNTFRKNIIVKSRNIGAGTITQARDFHYGWRATDPVATVVVAHEEDATLRHMRRYQDYHDSLPSTWQHPVKTRNETVLEYADTGALFRCVLAGGKGGGKSFTYQRAHFTELAYYNTNASDLYASVTAAMHETSPHYAITIESTSNGPGDYFHARVKDAKGDPDWNLLFFPWYAHETFRKEVPDAKKMLDSLSDEEASLIRTHDLSLEQILWRRQKIREGDIGAFRKYYPISLEEAFLSSGESYFPNAWLAALVEALPEWNKVPMRVFRRYDPTCTYAVGVDVGHGLKQDYSCIQVRDDLGRQVACWSDNVTPAHVVGEKAVELAVRYGMAILCIEAMGPGLTALERARQMGYGNLYADDGKLGFNTNSKSKELAFSHARKEMLDNVVEIRDRMTADEALNIREDAKGRIAGAKGHHDDHIMAWVLASWAARRIERPYRPPHEVLSERFGLGRGRLRDTIG